LAACRAALIATLLPDPGDPEKRRELVEKLGGTVVEKIEKKKMPSGKIVENIKEETVGGILHWKRETENKETLDWFREEIKKAYNGRAPKVLDPFAGGGAIPLEAMRLGCEATAIDINPVAWFILKCTLEYPQKLAGQKRPLPDFILEDRDFMEAFFKSQGFKGALLRTQLEKLGLKENRQFVLENFHGGDPLLEADLAWHVRAWGKWVLNQARKDLAKYYPTYADFEPLKDIGKKYKRRKMKLIPLREDGVPDIDVLNAEFDKKYLEVKINPRWVAKPTVAYLWARTVKCKNCRATIPLLKTRWLCKKANKRVLLTMEPNKDKTEFIFGVENAVPVKGGNAAQRREHDKKIGAGTMSRSGAQCPCCPTIMTMEDIRLEGKASRLGTIMTAVVVDGQKGKEYRIPTKQELNCVADAKNGFKGSFTGIPFGLINEAINPASTRSISCHLYGLDNFYEAFTPRQLLALATYIKCIRSTLKSGQFSQNDFSDSVYNYLCVVFGKLVDYCSEFCIWEPRATEIKHTFARFSFSMPWDFAECNPTIGIDRFYAGGIKTVSSVLDHLLGISFSGGLTHIIQKSADEIQSNGSYDLLSGNFIFRYF
jgi:adenine-specific DNA methylase